MQKVYSSLEMEKVKDIFLIYIKECAIVTVLTWNISSHLSWARKKIHQQLFVTTEDEG